MHVVEWVGSFVSLAAFVVFLDSGVVFILFFIFIYMRFGCMQLFLPCFPLDVVRLEASISTFYRKQGLLVFANALFEVRHPKQDWICDGAGFSFWFPFRCFCYCALGIFVCAVL